MYDSKLEDRYFTISSGYKPSTIATKLGHPSTGLTAHQLTLDKEEVYLTKVSYIAMQL